MTSQIITRLEATGPLTRAVDAGDIYAKPVRLAKQDLAQGQAVEQVDAAMFGTEPRPLLGAREYGLDPGGVSVHSGHFGCRGWQLA